MKIRKATIEDLPVLLDIFAYGRQLQRRLGNSHQWQNGHPKREVLEQDLRSGNSYVCVVNEHTATDLPEGTILATFYVHQGENPVFGSDQDEVWLNEDPYVTVHRMCSNGKVKGACQFCINWVTEQFDNVRIFTHEINQPMVHIVQKYGFQYCGEIYPYDAEPRKAFQYLQN